MVLNLPPELEKYIRSKIASGEFRDESDVVEEGLRLLAERDRSRQQRLDELKVIVAVGIEQADRGDLSDGEEVFQEIEDRLTESSDT